VLGNDLNAFGDEVGRIETDTELTDHGNISARAEGLVKIGLLGGGANEERIERINGPP